MRRKDATRPVAFTEMHKISKALGERNDCAVKAVAFAASVPYQEAHRVLQELGRKNRGRTYNHLIYDALRILGKQWRRVPPSSIIKQYPGRHKNKVYLTTHHPARFRQVWKNGRTYLAFIRGHVLCIRDGEVLDWTVGRSFRIVDLVEIQD